MAARKALNTFAKGAGIVAVGMALSKVLTYFYRLVVARFIGPEAYGQLSLGLAVLSIGGTVSLLAVNQAINKFVAEYNTQGDWASIRGVVLSSVEVTTPLSIAIAAGIYLSAGFISSNVFNSPGLAPVLKVLAFVLPVANFSKIVTATLTAFKEMKYRVITNQIFQNITQLAGTLALVYLGYGVLGAAGGWLLGVYLSTLLGLYYLERKVGPVLTRKVKPERHYRKIIRFSSPLLLSATIATFMGWADTAFLGYFASETEVGFYNVAFPTAMLLLLPYRSFQSIALPSMSEIRQRDERELPEVLKTLNRWTMSLSFPLFILMTLFSTQLLHLLFGREYILAEATILGYTVAATPAALTILATGQLYNAATGYLADVVKSASKTEIILKNTVAKLGLNVVLNIYLIGVLEMGIIGAALATSFSIIFVNSLLLLETYRFEGFLPFNRESLTPVLASLPAVTVTYLGIEKLFQTVPLWVLLPGAAVFGSIYMLSLILMGGVKEEDRDIIVGAGRRINMEDEADRLADMVIR